MGSSTKNTEEIQYITKRNFLDYFRKPKPFWFLQNSDCADFFNDKIVEESLQDLNELEDLFRFLREVDSDESLFFNNFFKLSKLLKGKLIECYKTKFRIPFMTIRDQTSIREDRTEVILELLKSPNDVFIFSPTITVKDLLIRPTALYKHRGKLYLIEHFWSTSLKRESLGTLVFYNHVLNNYLNVTVDQYLITYLTPGVSPNQEVRIEVTNCLPHKTKKVYPYDPFDPRLSNVNSYLKIPTLSYENTLYEILYSKEVYLKLIIKDWDIEELMSPEKVICDLRKFLKSEDRSINFENVAHDYLTHKGSMVSSDSTWFKFIFSKVFSCFTFSGNLVKFEKVIAKTLEYGDDTRKRIGGFLEYVGKLPFIKFPIDQDYIVFESAKSHFMTLKNKDIKIYYDFETISFPFPFLKNTKPYAQIVLQMSLIRVDKGKEEPVVNLIIDPLSLKVDDFKKIIDLIYTDKPNVAYIVYNKAFENSRLMEMAELIGEKEYKRKVHSIIDATIDLADWFTFGNNPFIIHKKLQGYHSIKKVIKLVSSSIERRRGAIQYSDLKRCQNGIMAQSLLMERALSEDPEGEMSNWEKNKGFMYKYCENDVRSMIAVEYLIEELLNNNKYGYYDLEKFLKDKSRFKKSF